MKKFFILLLSVLILSSGISAAEDIDLSGLSFEQLVALRERLNLAIWSCQEWQEVTVPAGVWVIGQDIPAGHWTIRPVPESYISVAYCDRLDEFGTGVGMGWLGWNGTLSSFPEEYGAGERREISLEMNEKMYFINSGAVIFTPYTGKPDLGFQ